MKAIQNAIEILESLLENENCTNYVDSYIQKTIDGLTEKPKWQTCNTCRFYSPWTCTDGSSLCVGDCHLDIRFGRELINECYQGYVKPDFGCTEYKPKEPQNGTL